MRIALPSGPRLMTCTASSKKAKEKFGGNDLVKTWWKNIVFTHQPLGVWRDQIRLELPVCFWQLCSKHTLECIGECLRCTVAYVQEPVDSSGPFSPSPPTCSVWAIHGKHIVTYWHKNPIKL